MTASSSATHWVGGSGETVSIGDHVAVDLDCDAVGQIVAVSADHTGRPVVLLTEGRQAGREVAVWPSQILLRVPR